MSSQERLVASRPELYTCVAAAVGGNVRRLAIDRTIWVAASSSHSSAQRHVVRSARRTHRSRLLLSDVIAPFWSVLLHTLVVRDGMFSRMAPWRVRAKLGSSGKTQHPDSGAIVVPPCGDDRKCDREAYSPKTLLSDHGPLKSNPL